MALLATLRESGQKLLSAEILDKTSQESPGGIGIPAGRHKEQA